MQSLSNEADDADDDDDEDDCSSRMNELNTEQWHAGSKRCTHAVGRWFGRWFVELYLFFSSSFPTPHTELFSTNDDNSYSIYWFSSYPLDSWGKKGNEMLFHFRKLIHAACGTYCWRHPLLTFSSEPHHQYRGQSTTNNKKAERTTRSAFYFDYISCFGRQTFSAIARDPSHGEDVHHVA